MILFLNRLILFLNRLIFILNFLIFLFLVGIVIGVDVDNGGSDIDDVYDDVLDQIEVRFTCPGVDAINGCFVNSFCFNFCFGFVAL